jgi:hypothetical protein
LFDGLASLVAKAVEKENVRIVRLNSNEPQSCTCAGNAAVKTEEAMLEIDVAGWLMERFAQNDAQQLLENYKASLRKEGDRTAMYKQKWEDTEAILEKEGQDHEDERQSWEEEKKRMEKKIIQLEAQLAYAKENPQTFNILLGDHNNIGDQNNTGKTEVHSETKIEEIKVESGGTGVNGVPMQTESSCQEVEKKDKEDIEYCKYIQYDKVALDNDWGLGYGETAEEKHKLSQKRYEAYNRHLMKLIQKADYKNLALACMSGERKGILDFQGDNKTTIGKYFKGLCAEKNFIVDSFTKECYLIGWQPKSLNMLGQ